jgi:hypothetical protein
MHLDLKLPDLPRLSLSLSETLLRRPLANLLKIKTRNEERWGAGGGSRIFENRKEKLRKRLQGAISPTKELKKIQSTEVGWQRLLMSLFIESHGQDWLPAFDDGVAPTVLGNDGTAWNASRRRQAAILFFERFDSLPALPFLATQLRSAFASHSTASGDKAEAWARERNIIFQPNGHERAAKAAKKGEALQQLMERYAIPATGAYAVKLRQVFLLETLQRCPLGEEPTVLREIETDRDKVAIDSLPLGAAALRILVSRVGEEGGRKWPKEWRKWLVRLGCDPRMGRHTAEGAKWWGWATSSQWNLAVQGIIGLSLKIFFDFLDGTVSVHQWEERRQFLEACFNSGKILDARLVLNSRCMQRLPAKMRDRWNTASLNSTTEDTCIIALRCTDDIYLLEGTHSYALRAFHRSFPVKGFWERSTQNYTDAGLRIHENFCPVYVRHMGDWASKFYNQLQSKFHVEWATRKR